MSQNDFNLANQGFPSMRSDMNSALQALASNSAGDTEPSTTYAYQWWYDETNDILKIRNSANDAWIDFATFDQTTGSFADLTIDGDLTVDTDTLFVDASTDSVGINNASPSSSLDVAGDAKVSGDLTVDTDTLYVDSSNNRVGIGTSSPSSALDVQGDVGVSGGVYLGGTGAANKLDDYEEGTWGGSASLIATNTSATSISVTNATYQKIGDRVTVEGIVDLTGDDFSSVGDYVLFDGLPFTAKVYSVSRSPSVGSCGTGKAPLGNRNGNGSARVQESTDNVMLVLTSEPQGSPIASDDEIAFTLSYLIT